MSETAPLKLRALDPEDMDVIAALLQDALVPLADMAFLAKEKRFVMVANRFQWPKDQAAGSAAPARPTDTPEGEDAAFDDSDNPPPFERVNSGICFDKVERVRFRGMSPADKDEILSLLTITSEPRSVTLLFSGDAAVRLEISALHCHLEDLGRPWPTRWRPDHDGSQDSAADPAKSGDKAEAQSESGGE